MSHEFALRPVHSINLAAGPEVERDVKLQRGATR
jgi:hypothetical protein